MKIYILADMEGISGIRRPEQVDQQSPEFGRGLMMQDVNACIDGAQRGGATEVVVADTHAGGGQFLLADMDERAIYEMPAMGRMMSSLDRSFDGLILMGHHAKAGTLNGFLDHTMSSASWFDYRLNGVSLGEIGIESAWAGHYGVPTIMVEGDEAAAAETRDLLGDVPCAVVKWALGRNRAKCLPLPKAHEIVRETAAQAVARAKSIKPYQPKLPGIAELTFYRTDMCDEWAAKRGYERVDARTIRWRVEKLLDVRPS